MSMVQDAGLLVTDSDGIQEETTFLQAACLALRPNAERPMEVESIVPIAERAFSGSWKTGTIPSL